MQWTLLSKMSCLTSCVLSCCHNTGFQTLIRYLEKYWFSIRFSILATAEVLLRAHKDSQRPKTKFRFEVRNQNIRWQLSLNRTDMSQSFRANDSSTGESLGQFSGDLSQCGGLRWTKMSFPLRAASITNECLKKEWGQTVAGSFVHKWFTCPISCQAAIPGSVCVVLVVLKSISHGRYSSLSLLYGAFGLGLDFFHALWQYSLSLGPPSQWIVGQTKQDWTVSVTKACWASPTAMESQTTAFPCSIQWGQMDAVQKRLTRNCFHGEIPRG